MPVASHIVASTGSSNTGRSHGFRPRRCLAVLPTSRRRQRATPSSRSLRNIVRSSSRSRRGGLPAWPARYHCLIWAGILQVRAQNPDAPNGYRICFSGKWGSEILNCASSRYQYRPGNELSCRCTFKKLQAFDARRQASFELKLGYFSEFFGNKRLRLRVLSP